MCEVILPRAHSWCPTRGPAPSYAERTETLFWAVFSCRHGGVRFSRRPRRQSRFNRSLHSAILLFTIRVVHILLPVHPASPVVRRVFEAVRKKEPSNFIRSLLQEVLYWYRGLSSFLYFSWRSAESISLLTTVTKVLKSFKFISLLNVCYWLVLKATATLSARLNGSCS
jgi:hypothetical protein